MKLIDFLEVCSEYKEVSVCDWQGRELCRYNGKDSIDKKYNNCEILNISIHNDMFVVYLQLIALGRGWEND